MAVFGLPWPLVLLAAASMLAGLLAMALVRAAAAADRAMDEPRERVVGVAELPPLAEDRTLALRVRRASARWPLTELDPIERATFASAVAQARSFDDLDLPWQELILAAERGSHPHARHASR